MAAGTDAIGNDGGGIDLDSAPMTIDYNVDDTVNYLEVSANGRVYRQTFTYNGSGKVTNISEWVRQ